MKRLLLILSAIVFCGVVCFAGPKIYINPGHGGYNSNDRNIVTINHASGDHNGFWESQANLTKGLFLRDMLQTAGATVYMSRTDNRSGYRDDNSISTSIGDRPLSTIAKEASNKADFFLSIHSNASGNTTTSATNYLLLMLTGTSGSGDWGSSFKYTEAKTAATKAWSRLSANSVTYWTSTTQRIMSYTTYTVISPSYLTIPGYLSEGEFHDYKPEAHRLLNEDYCKLEAYRFLQAFCDYYSSSLTKPTTGVICGDVRDASATMASYTLYQKATGDKDNYKPLNGAKVKLKDGSGNVIATYTCDDEWNGFYAFWDVAPGTYQVQCAADEHASQTKSVTVTAATISYNNVKLGSGSGDGMEDETQEQATFTGVYVTFGGKSLYIVPEGTANVQVKVYDAENGLEGATVLKTLTPATAVAVTPVAYSTTATVNDNTLTVKLYKQETQVASWQLSPEDVGGTTPPVLTPVEGANIYASELTMTEADGTYTFSYRLNTDATDVKLQLLYEGVVIQEKSFGAQSAGIQSGSISTDEINFPARNNDDHLTWAIKATGESVNVLTKLSDDATKFQLFRPMGVAVDMNPESEYFGRVYVTNVKNGTCSAGRTTANGIFAFDAGLNALNTSAYTGGVSWNNATFNGNSPFRLAVAEDGRVFICDWSDKHSGMWIAPAGGITGNFTELFAGLTRASSGLCTNSSNVAVHGSISGCWVSGSGAQTKLYTMDEDYTVNSKTYNLLRYDIGNATSWSAAPSAVEFENNGMIVNNVLNVVSDLHQGFWIIQHRFAETSENPSLIHVLNGTTDYNSGGEQLLENSKNSGLAVNYDGTRIATTSQSQINIWNVTYDAEGHVTDISTAAEITSNDISGLSEYSNDVAFDPAGNVYYVSNSSERLVVIGLPKEDNSFVTPARSVYTIAMPDEPTPVSVTVTEWQNNGLTVDFGAVPTATAVIAKLGSVTTEELTLETLYAHTATDQKATTNDKHITLPSTINLYNNYGGKLTLVWMNGTETIGQTVLDIPLIIQSSNTFSGAYWPATLDVIVPSGVTLTLTPSDKTIRSLQIYPGGKVILKSGSLTVTDLILRYGWTTAHTALDVPQLTVNSGATLNHTNAYLDCVIDYARYYPLAVPYEVTFSAISYRDYPAVPTAGNVILRQYDGAQRATGVLGSNWKTVTPAALTPTNGYILAAKRPDEVMYSVVRMPLDMTKTQTTASVTAYGVGSANWLHTGWNFIANPYLVTYTGADPDAFGVRYATIPNSDFTDYYQTPIDEAQLQPFSPFFIQVGADANINFTQPSAKYHRLTTNDQRLTTTSDIRVRLTTNDHRLTTTFDQTYILCGPNYTDDPDYNADLPKEFGLAPKIWSQLSDDLAALALPDTRNEYIIPLGLFTTAGTYTFSLNANTRLGNITRVELLDNGQTVADLVNSDYTTSLPAGKILGRFALRIIQSPTAIDQNPTPNDQRPTTNDQRPTATKRILDHQVVIDSDGRTYDLRGAIVE